MRCWVVDGSNVVGSRPDGWWRDRPRALGRLLDEVVRWREVVGEPVVLVADGDPTPLVPEGDHHGVTVRYAHSRARDAADDEIVRIVEAGGPGDGGAELVVVTSDRRLRARVDELGVTTEGARRFLDRLADIEPRREDRAVLAHFGIDESALLGRGGEARVYALDDDRVARLPQPGTDPATLEDRRRFLEVIAAGPFPVPTPQVLEHVDVGGRLVVVERRLPGRNAMEVLDEPGADRAGLVRHHLDLALAIAELPCPTASFGELWGPDGLRAPTFAAWSNARLARSLRAGGAAFAHVDPAAVTSGLVAALPEPEPPAPRLVHLDVFLGNLLAADGRVTALLDFGPMALGGPSHLDALVAIAYLDADITPVANDGDRAVARAWADEHGLSHAVTPARRWAATYWTGAPGDPRLQRWCRAVLG